MFTNTAPWARRFYSWTTRWIHKVITSFGFTLAGWTVNVYFIRSLALLGALFGFNTFICVLIINKSISTVASVNMAYIVFAHLSCIVVICACFSASIATSSYSVGVMGAFGWKTPVFRNTGSVSSEIAWFASAQKFFSLVCDAQNGHI